MIRVVKVSIFFMVFVAIAVASTFLAMRFFIQRETTVVVPELVGKDVVYALQILTDLGLNIKLKSEEHSSVISLNHIIHQDPSSGSKIKKDRDVRIIVSKGEKRIQMPRITGLSIRKTRIVLEESDLCQGNLTRTYDNRLMTDDVIAQNPKPGVMVDRGVCVDLLVSLGIRPEAHMMPDLLGQVFENAVIEIEKHNLLLGEITAAYNKDKPKNVIVNQNPPAGHRIFEGYPVTLARNIQSRMQKMSPLQATQGVNLFRYRLKSGFLKSRIRIQLAIFGMVNDLWDDFMKPGEEVWLFIPKGVDATVNLFEDEEPVVSKTFEAW
jgi:beta-lactam-binding protein with PASTA domain